MQTTPAGTPKVSSPLNLMYGSGVPIPLNSANTPTTASATTSSHLRMAMFLSSPAHTLVEQGERPLSRRPGIANRNLSGFEEQRQAAHHQRAGDQVLEGALGEAGVELVAHQQARAHE